MIDEVVDALEFSGSDKGAKSTDVEIWRKIPDDYYSPSIHVTEQGDIGINVGGYVLVAPVERWFAAGEAANRKGCLTEDDYIVRMPPVREYTVRAKINSIEKARPPNLVVEDEVVDAMKICGCGLAKELCCWDELSDEALVEFEKVIDESARKPLDTVDPRLIDYMEHPQLMTSNEDEPSTFWEKIRYWTFDDWKDWLMGR